MSKNALTRHQAQGICHERQLAMQQERFPPSTPPVVETVLNNYEDDNSYSSDDMLPCPPSPPAKRAVFLRDVADIPAHDVDKVTMQIGPLFADTNSSESEEEGTSNKYASYAGGFKAYEASSDASHDSLANDDYSEEDTMFMGENNKELGANAPIPTGPDHSMRDGFREYVAYAKTNFAELTKEEKSAIRILHILKSKNAPMNAYESIMLWHLKQSNQLHQQGTLGDYSGYIGRKKIYEKTGQTLQLRGAFPLPKGHRATSFGHKGQTYLP